jgi:hypothetical protein
MHMVSAAVVASPVPGGGAQSNAKTRSGRSSSDATGVPAGDGNKLGGLDGILVGVGVAL